MLQGYGCRGAAAIPPQESCVICRRCGIEAHLCEGVVASTTTTTLVGGTTTTTLVDEGTTTSLPGGGTTTTTLQGGTTATTVPDTPCRNLSGLPLGTCLLATALEGPLCPGTSIPEKTDRKLRAKLTTVATKAAATSKRAKRIPDGCRAAVTDLAGAVQDALR